MSYNVPDPNGGPHTRAVAEFVPIDGMTGKPMGAPGSTPMAVDNGAKVTSVPALEAGGTGILGWLSQIWRALTGTLTVTTGQITSVTATIANGASVSGDIDLGAARLGRIAMPAAWTAADLTLQTSHDNVTWNNLFDKDGGEYTIKAAQGRSMLIPLADMLSVRYLRIRSGTSATPVAQAAARSLILVLVP